LNIDAAIVGIGCSTFGRGLPDSQLRLAAVAFKEALADAGLQRSDVDGLSIHLGWPLGVDYDRIAEGFGLDIRYVNQAWLHGRFVTNALQHAALAVSAGLADVVACVTAVSFTRQRGFLGGPGDIEGNREEGAHMARPRPMASPRRRAALQSPCSATCISTARPSLPRCRLRCATMH
jgi:acetyl-CoA acetyltransferase